MPHVFIHRCEHLRDRWRLGRLGTLVPGGGVASCRYRRFTDPHSGVRVFAAMRIAIAVLLVSSVASADSSITDKAQLADPIQVDSVTITPIVAAPQKDAPPDMIVLDEAMPKKLVRIHEVDEGNVNSLTLDNKSDKPLFLLAGEVVIGGKQDRIIGRNTVVPAKSTQEVPVFCVEHGRWDGKTKEFTTAKALAHGRLRGMASFESQQDVWNEVAQKNEKLATKSDTDTYRKIALSQGDKDSKIDKAAKQVDAALAKIPERNKVVGFAVAVNGKVATVDLFNSHALFEKLEGKLVRSYITEAVDVKADKAAKAPNASDVKTFMSDADKAAEAPSYDTSAATTTVKAGHHNAKAGVMYKPAPAAKASEDVYQNYQSLH